MHFTIADPLPASAWGTGGSPLADYDGDGDLDVVISRRQTQTDVGDVDGDGDIDIITKVWNKDGVAYHADFWRNDTPR